MILGTPEAALLKELWLRLRARLASLDGEGGYSSETVLITALLVVLAITAVGYITTKVIAKAKGLSLE
jgi:hypothetical protein